MAQNHDEQAFFPNRSLLVQMTKWEGGCAIYLVLYLLLANNCSGQLWLAFSAQVFFPYPN